MPDSTKPDLTQKAPWHLWLIGGVLMLWNVLAATDYVLSVVQGDAYYGYSGMTEAQVQYFSTFPGWVTAAWTASVWGCVFGSIVLLLRFRFAVPLLIISLFGTVAYIIYGYALSEGRSAMGDIWFMPAIIAVVTALVSWYAFSLSRRGVLR